MSTRPVLGDWEIPHVSELRTFEERAFAEFAVPGRGGSLFQDLDRMPLRMLIGGSLYGDEARNEFLTAVRERFLAGDPVTFTADILTATELQYVVIETLKFRRRGASAEEMEFLVVVRESPPPPPPPDPLGSLDAGLLDDAGGLLDSVTGALDMIDALGSVPDLGDPTAPLSEAADEVAGALAGIDAALGPLRDILGSDD